MKAVALIPARYQSSRFPGKPLANIQGKPMLGWVIQGAQKSTLVERVIVVTDDQRIAQASTEFGAESMLTDPDIPTGTDRIWEVVKNMDIDVAVNVQGDEPLLEPRMIDDLVRVWEASPECEMATLARPFLNKGEVESVSTAKVLLNSSNEAIYFSRYPIPYSRGEFSKASRSCYKHVGMYAFKKQFLQKYCMQPPCEIEVNESLEQLRALYLGAKIKVVVGDYPSLGVDLKEDILKIEKILERRDG